MGGAMRVLLQVIMVVTLTMVIAGCGEETAPSPRSEGEVEPPVSAAPAAGGTIEALITYSGPPTGTTVRVNKDVEECGREQRIEKIAVGSGHGLIDAVVSITGSESAAPPSSAKPTLDQKGCRFHPHVLAMTPGEVQILNSDGILHNIHTLSVANPPFNKAQPRFKKVMTEEFEEPEFIRIKCDVHSWMEGWIAVMPTPLFGVTADDGRATIRHVPAGAHTIEVWHPVLGKQTRSIDVNPGQTTRVTFEYKA
jgi:plastocyanin